MVGEILKDNNTSTNQFPILPGSHLSFTNPALEFIKAVLEVLKLDGECEHEVLVLRKSLLSQIGVEEYSSEVAWRNPCASFVLPHVFCSECHEARDLNLCVLPECEDEGDSDIKKQWECEDCGIPYDQSTIEWRLVRYIQRKSIQYQLQDLRCTKTHAVATNCLARQSGTCAEFRLDLPRRDMVEELRLLNNIAGFYELEWLTETTDSLMNNHG
eukprot:CAMPEP_0171308434 /NCGR_PEP_ID=MMETSP0816-20121228/18586_1 /TAXON_ID=420281 /ORGANISM="Proboscia inermis, Strain CCAP1064/1" /LENGTH=213 /DNA_ID=CAMNT_0011791345 /DNA_START=207 /DNA_END=848 /DNA_ORIENTATION=-